MSQTSEELKIAKEAQHLIFKHNLNSYAATETTRKCTEEHGLGFLLDSLKEMDSENPKPGEVRITQLQRIIKVKAAGIKYEKKHDKLERGREEAERIHEDSRKRGYKPDFFHIYDQLEGMKDREYGLKGLALLFDKATVLKELDEKLAAGMDKGVYEVTKQTVEAVFSYKPPVGSPFSSPLIVNKPKPVEFANDEDILF